ncbi:MAG TPA: flippase-like domain-containing protein [Anaerolineae bacterium]|nr:flippase-like domain-containing protein [Anaerolineae bacterium]
MTMQTADTPPSQKQWGRIVRGFAIGLAALFLARALYTNWRKIPPQSLEIHPWWICLAVVGILGTILLQAVSWGMVLRFLGQEVGWSQGIRLWTVAQTAKYVPGSIWNWVARIYLSGREGMSLRITTLSILLENVFLVLACLLIVGVLGIPVDWFARLRWLILLPTLLIGLLFIFWPHLLTRIAGRLRRENHKPPFSIGSKEVLMTATLYLLNMLLGGLVWFPFVRIFYRVPPSALPGLVGSVLFAFVVGYLAVFVPQGWGVREGLLSVLLAHYMPEPVAVVVAILSRVWIIGGEVTVLGIVLLLSYFQRVIDQHHAGR